MNSFNSHRHRSYAERALNCLCLIPSEEAAKTIVDYYLDTHKWERYHKSYTKKIAARLAYSQSVQTLENIHNRFEKTEHFLQLLLPWIAELVLRGEIISPANSLYTVYVDNVTRFYQKILLPPYLLEVESELPSMGSDFNQTGMAWMSPGISYNKELAVSNEIEKIDEVTELDADVHIANILAATHYTYDEYMEEDADDRYFPTEARTFAFADKLDDNYETILRSLPLMSLGYDEDLDHYNPERTATVPLVISSLTYKQAFNDLMWLSANQGPYSDAELAATCRELAWLGISGLCGISSNDPVLIEKEMRQCQFVAYTTEAGYFSHVCTDFAMLCIRNDLKTVSVLAYSDCD